MPQAGGSPSGCGFAASELHAARIGVEGRSPTYRRLGHGVAASAPSRFGQHTYGSRHGSDGRQHWRDRASTLPLRPLRADGTPHVALHSAASAPPRCRSRSPLDVEALVPTNSTGLRNYSCGGGRRLSYQRTDCASPVVAEVYRASTNASVPRLSRAFVGATSSVAIQFSSPAIGPMKASSIQRRVTG